MDDSLPYKHVHKYMYTVHTFLDSNISSTVSIDMCIFIQF